MLRVHGRAQQLHAEQRLGLWPVSLCIREALQAQRKLGEAEVLPALVLCEQSGLRRRHVLCESTRAAATKGSAAAETAAPASHATETASILSFAQPSASAATQAASQVLPSGPIVSAATPTRLEPSLTAICLLPWRLACR